MKGIALNERIVLVENGVPRFRVFPDPPQDQEAFRGPVMELRHYLERATGANVLSEEPAEVDVVVRFAPDEGLAAEQFAIEARPGAVCLMGSTVQALYHAVYYFLEQAFGIRWLWPGPSGEVVPRAESVSWPVGRIEQEPAFAWRHLGTGGACWERYDVDFATRAFARVPAEAQEAFVRWRRRMRTGGLRIADGHRWAQFCSPEQYGKSHPEYFALVNGARDTKPRDGKHGNQPCTTNPDVVALIADKVAAQFDARPELDAYSISINDGLGFCECERCRALDDWAGAGAHEEDAVDRATAEGPGVGKGGRAITDRIFRFANEIAERVSRRWPGKLLLIHVYSLFRTPPKRVSLHPSIIAQFCTPTPQQAFQPFFESEIETLSRLGTYAQRIGMYDYLQAGKRGGLPIVLPHVIKQSIAAYHRAGARYYATQCGHGFAVGALNYYVLTRLLWDPETDVDAVMEDFCRAGFGQVAHIVRAYFDAFEERWRNVFSRADAQSFTGERLAVELYPEDFRKARRTDLADARKAAAGDAQVAERIAFLAKGLDFVDLFAEASARLFDLESLGVSVAAGEDAGAAAQDPARVRTALEAALAARDRVLAFVRDHTGEFICAEVWFYYFYHKRRCLLSRLDDVQR